MTTSLFRPEAIDAHRAKIWGEVTLSLPLSLTAMTLFPRCLHGQHRDLPDLRRPMHARCMLQGFLATRLGVANIIASCPGIITDLHVKEGQFVAAGTPLITISLQADERSRQRQPQRHACRAAPTEGQSRSTARSRNPSHQGGGRAPD